MSPDPSSQHETYQPVGLNGSGASSVETDNHRGNRPGTPNGDSRVERFTRALIKFRWAVLFGVLSVTLLAGRGASKLGLATDYRVFFSDDNPDLAAYEAVENVYTKNDNVLFVIRPESGDVFSPRILGLVRSLTEDGWQIPNSTRVDGITNFQHTYADGDELIVEDLVGAGDVTGEIAERARRVAMSEPLLAGRLVSDDARTTGVNVRISLPGESEEELPATVEHVRDLIAEYRAAYPDVEIHASGVAMMNWAFAEAPMRDMPVVMPLMFGAFLLAIVLILRSPAAIFGTLTVLAFSVVTTLGIAGHLGVFLDPVSSSAPTVILTLAVADSIHILVTWLVTRRSGLAAGPSLVEAMRVNAKPVFLTSLTTAIGFLSLNFSDSPPFRLLGNLSAAGVMIAWVYSMVLLPAVVSIIPSRAPEVSKDDSRSFMDGFADFVTRHHRAVLAGSGAAALALSLSMARLRINDQYIDYFAESLPIRIASDFTVDNLSGIYAASFSLPAGGSQEISDPEYLATVDAFTDYLESRPAIVHVSSFTRTMKRLNMNLHADDPAQYRLPADQQLAAQYLLLYELSLPYGLDVNDQIDVDKSSLRLNVTFGDVEMQDVERETLLAEAWLRENGTPSMRTAEATGVPEMFSHITRRNVSSMVVGTVLGFLLIAAVLTVALRSVRLGLISLIPNVLPASMAFGVWAWLVHDVGFAVSVVAGLSIGIIVDDTVHFLTKYNLARREKDMTPVEAVRYAFHTVGTAIVGTTVIVAAGFAMLGLSTFRVTSYMGLLTSLTVVIALFVDFFLLPALLIAFDRRGSEEAHLTDAEIRAMTSTNTSPGRRALAGTAMVALLAAGVTALLTASASPLAAQESAEEAGLRIALEAERRDLGWGDNSSTMRMVLHNQNGDESVRELRRQALENNVEGEGDKSLIVFDAPRDVAGTSLLSHTRILEADDQWLFLPALERVKRISSANKSGPFVGSEFAYEDLVSQEVEKYDYRYLGEAPCGDLRCYEVERLPRYENSGYTRQVVWWDTDEYRIQRIDYYDRKNDLLKTLTYHGYRSYLDRFWRPDRMSMENHQNGKSTELVFSEWSFANGLDEAEFTPSRLRRAR